MYAILSALVFIIYSVISMAQLVSSRVGEREWGVLL